MAKSTGGGPKKYIKIEMKTSSVRLPAKAWEALGEIAERRNAEADPLTSIRQTSSLIISQLVRDLLKTEGYTDVYPSSLNPDDDGDDDEAAA